MSNMRMCVQVHYKVRVASFGSAFSHSEGDLGASALSAPIENQFRRGGKWQFLAATAGANSDLKGDHCEARAVDTLFG